MRRIIQFIVLAFSTLFPVATGAQSEKLVVVATTSIIADVAQKIGADLVEVTALLPPDSDLHAYQPTPADLVLIAEADIVLVNGAGLETFLGDLVENAAGKEPVVVSNGVEILAIGEHGHEDEQVEDEHIGLLGVDTQCALEDDHNEADSGVDHAHGTCDPHVWTDPHNVIIWVGNIAEAFAAADAANAATYRANAAVYVEQLQALDAEVTQILAVIPKEKRVLVTNHEFFAYFAHRYGFEIAGVVIGGGGTLSEPDPQQLAELVEMIEAEGVPAIFAEISASDRLAQVVADETGINVVTSIYSDSLSGLEGPASTYLDYLRYNARVIAEALSQ